MPSTPENYTGSLEKVLDLHAEIGEGPIWDARQASLVFVESFGGTIYRYWPRTGELRRWRAGEAIGVAIPRSRGGLVVTGCNGVLALDERSGGIELLVPIEPERTNNRMNDGKCDSRGRLWSGTFSTIFERRQGTLYRIEPDLRATAEMEGVYISNGIAWSPDETRMYYVDSARRGIDVFDYDIRGGKADNLRRFATIERSDGIPDGICSDAEGCLWVALYCGGQVRRYSPSGEWIGTIHLPCLGVTSCGFGGEDLRDLYITTGTHLPEGVCTSQQESAGALFRCRPGVKGAPVFPFAG